MDIRFTAPELPETGTVVLLVSAERRLGRWGGDVDSRCDGLATRALEAGGFQGKVEETLALITPRQVDARRLLLVGLGEAAKLDRLAAERAGGSVAAALNGVREDTATVLIDTPDGGLSEAELASALATGMQLRAYRFDRYRTREKPEDKPTLQNVTLGSAEADAARQRYARDGELVAGVHLTRELNSEPANILYPEALAERCRELQAHGVSVEILDRQQLEALGMGALLGVAKGSARPPAVAIMRWQGAAADQAPVAFVGKGVTFDSGGISLKPASGMEDMKMDMGGAGVVTGLMRSLAGRGAKVNAVGIVGLVENMPSGDAMRPGDIVTSLSGQTVEILNTDAEGRLVLADVLHYVQQRFQPGTVIDLATLTGAILVALGTEIGGLFANDDALANALGAAGETTGERVWRLPLDETFDKELNSDNADMRNVTGQRYAGSSIAGQFLKRFIGEDVRWAHLDIAGVSWSTKDKALRARGATGFGVRLLDRWVADNVETVDS